MALTLINFEDGTDGNAVTTSETNVQAVVGGGADYAADTGVSGSLAADVDVSAYGGFQMAPTSSGDIYILAYVKFSQIPASTADVLQARSWTTSNATLAQVQINSSGQLRIRDVVSEVDAGTTVLSTGTWYRLEWRVNRTGGTQELRIFDGPHGTTAIETPLTGSCSASPRTETNRILFGAVSAGGAVTVRYDDCGWDTAWPGPTGSSGTPGAATYDLTIANSSDTATIADRTYQIDARGSTGTVTLAWDGTSRGAITESPTGVFTIADPDDGTDPLLLVLTAAGSGGGADDDLGISIPRGGSSTRSFLVYDGTATAGNIDNWG